MQHMACPTTPAKRGQKPQGSHLDSRYQIGVLGKRFACAAVTPGFARAEGGGGRGLGLNCPGPELRRG